MSTGLKNTIDKILAGLGYSDESCYVASNLWELQYGSAKISIAYDRNTGFIYGDAVLCRLPENPPDDLWTYLLSQNNRPGILRLSIKDQAVVLSWTAYDKYFSEETAREYIKEHLQTADYLDNLLMERFGCGLD